MLEKKYEVKSRLKVCGCCQSFDKDTGEYFPPKKFEEHKDYLECTNPECLEVFSTIPMFEFAYCCPDCGFDCPVEDEHYQVRDDGSWNIFPYELLNYKPVITESKETDPNIILIEEMDKIMKVKLPPMPDDLKELEIIEGKDIYPKCTDEYLDYEGNYSWTETHYCPHCKKEYDFFNGN
jgi:hypothetical protein